MDVDKQLSHASTEYQNLAKRIVADDDKMRMTANRAKRTGTNMLTDLSAQGDALYNDIEAADRGEWMARLKRWMSGGTEGQLRKLDDLDAKVRATQSSVDTATNALENPLLPQ
jgi:hypothetical protein